LRLLVVSDAQSATGARNKLALFRDRNYLVYLIGNTISGLGSWAQRIGIGWLSWDLTHQTRWVGAISLAQLLPLILFGPLFGTLLDRHDHRRYALSVNVLLAILALALYLLTAWGLMNIGLLCVMALLLGMANSAFQSVRLAIVNDVVQPAHLSTAIAFNAVMFNVTRAVGPAIAGLIIASHGIAAAFAANAASFISILGALLFMRLRPRLTRHARHGILKESLEGLRYVMRDPQLRRFIVVSGVSAVFARGIIELLPAFADSVFHRGSVGLANLTTAVGLGAIAGGLTLSREERVPQLTRIASYLVGGAVCLFGLCTAYWAGLLAICLLGFVVVICGIGLQVLLQGAVGDQYRGRVLGLWTAVSVAGPGVGGAVAGFAAQLLGLKAVTVLFGVCCLALVIWLNPRSPPALEP
jgi:MFS family permease